MRNYVPVECSECGFLAVINELEFDCLMECPSCIKNGYTGCDNEFVMLSDTQFLEKTGFIRAK